MRRGLITLMITGSLLFLSACAEQEHPQEMAAELRVPAGSAATLFTGKGIGLEEIISDVQQEENVVTYETEEIHLSLSLPGTWKYRIRTIEDLEKEDGMMNCSIDFWPEAFPDAVFKFGYCQQFGMCGTGVTTEKIELASGLGGYRHTEKTEKELWLTITFDRPDDSKTDGLYVIMASPELCVWEQIEAEFEEILNSVRTGR